MMTLQTIVKAATNQVRADLNQEAVVLNLSNGVYYGLNPMATTVWDFIQQPQSVAQIIERITGEYEVDYARCERDVKTLLEDLKKYELIEVVSE